MYANLHGDASLLPIRFGGQTVGYIYIRRFSASFNKNFGLPDPLAPHAILQLPALPSQSSDSRGPCSQPPSLSWGLVFSLLILCSWGWVFSFLLLCCSQFCASSVLPILFAPRFTLAHVCRFISSFALLPSWAKGHSSQPCSSRGCALSFHRCCTAPEGVFPVLFFAAEGEPSVFWWLYTLLERSGAQCAPYQKCTLSWSKLPELKEHK
jgi:hypothetical protein